MVVGAVTGGTSQADRLHTVGMVDDPAHGGSTVQSSPFHSTRMEQPHGSMDGSISPSESSDDITIEAVTTRTAPGAKFDDVRTVADVSELATETETIAAEDVLVIEVAATGLSNALVEESGNSNARFLELVRSGVLEVRIENEASNTTLDLAATNETGGLRVIPETDGSDVYALIDTERAVFTNSTTGVTTGDLVVTVDSQDTDEAVSTPITVTPRKASLETNGEDVLKLTADSNRTITGDTTVAPQTNLTVHLRSNEEATFNITHTTRVKEDGSFSLRVDFGNVTKGTQFVVLIPGEGFSEEAKTEGVLTAASSASVSLTGQQFENDSSKTITVKDANLSEGGFLAVYNQSFLTQNRSEARESYMGVSEYRQPGSHSNVSITLDGDYRGDGTVIVVPHLDTNDNGEFDSHNTSIDGPYRGADGGAIIAVVNASTGSTTHWSTDQPAPPPHSGSGPSEPADNGDADPSETAIDAGSDGRVTEQGTETTDSDGASNARLSDVDGPGFGPLAGLIALSITALIAAMGRRH